MYSSRKRRSGLWAGLLTGVMGVGVLAIAQPFAAGSTAQAVAPAAVAAAPAPAPVYVVGFGDSVPLGKHCGGCGDLFTLYARSVAAPGAPITVVNRAKGNTTSSDALAAMRSSSAEAAIRKATAVVIFTGADDVEPAWRKVSKGSSAKKNYTPVENKVKSNVEKMIDLAHSLHPGVKVAVLDYWGALEDGDVAKQNYSKAQIKAAESATDYVNKGLAGAARHSHAAFVSTYHLFKGQNGTANPTKYLADDGNHPNAAGMHLITAALVDAMRS